MAAIRIGANFWNQYTAWPALENYWRTRWPSKGSDDPSVEAVQIKVGRSARTTPHPIDRVDRVGRAAVGTVT